VSILALFVVVYKIIERKKERSKANLKYRLTEDTTGHGYQALIITNDGPSEARNIEVTLDGRPLNRCPFPVLPKGKIGFLSPNTDFRYSLFAGTGVPLPTEITLHWSDDFREDRSLEGSLSYTP
jgi:hypothetical protein